MIERLASCSCGALAARCVGEPSRISVCHCGECKKRTGSAFSAQATYREEEVTLSGEPSTFTRHGEDGGHWVTTSFCPTCGSTVWYRIEQRPGMVSIPLGCFADANFPEPRVSVYDGLRLPWVELHTVQPLERRG